MFVYLSNAGRPASAFLILLSDIPPIRIVLLSVFPPIQQQDQGRLSRKINLNALIFSWHYLWEILNAHLTVTFKTQHFSHFPLTFFFLFRFVDPYINAAMFPGLYPAEIFILPELLYFISCAITLPPPVSEPCCI